MAETNPIKQGLVTTISKPTSTQESDAHWLTLLPDGPAITQAPADNPDVPSSDMPLTTTYTPPRDCGAVYKSWTADISYEDYIVDLPQTCLPEKFAEVSGVYSPGLACPSGYWTACINNSEGTSTATCCPIISNVGRRHSLSCIATPRTLLYPWETVLCTWEAAETGEHISATYISYQGSVVLTSLLVSPEGVEAYGVRLKYQATELPSTTSSLPESSASSDQNLDSIGVPSDEPSGGLSGGAIAGITVGAVLGALLFLLLGFFLARWQRRRQERLLQEQQSSTLIASPYSADWAGLGLAQKPELPSSPVQNPAELSATREEAVELDGRAVPVEMPSGSWTGKR